MSLDRFEVIRTLGQGAFGRTLLARERESDRQVALKLLDARGTPDWKAYELFEREATVLRGLRHQGVPEVFATFRDVWEGRETAFLSMEYIEGTSLAGMIAAGTHLEPANALHLFVELLGVLEYLHGRVPPILHRDIKPSNIIVRSNGYPALVDFGSVRNVFLTADEAGSTIAGTYGYMPYEQYMGQASPSSDLYAAAATMLHLLTHRPPKDFMNADGRLDVPVSLPGGERLSAVLARMLRPSPAQRFASAREAIQAMLAVPESTAVAPRTPVLPVATGPAPAPGARREASLPPLPPAPRALNGVTLEYFRRVAHGTWTLMDPTAKPGDKPGLTGMLGLAFFSVVTAGVLPISFFSMASSRRRRLRRFFRHGEAALAEIISMEPEDVGFSVKLTRVKYEFRAEGALHRDSDVTLPAIADRWRVGDQIQVLYLADEEFDSVIISA